MSRLWQPDSERLSSRVVGLETDFSHVALESFDNARQGSPQEPWDTSSGRVLIGEHRQARRASQTGSLGELEAEIKLVLWFALVAVSEIRTMAASTASSLMSRLFH